MKLNNYPLVKQVSAVISRKKKVIQNNLLKLLYSNYENDNENLLQITDKPIMATNHGRTLAMDKPTMDINHGRTLAMEVEYFNFKPVRRTLYTCEIILTRKFFLTSY